jgi:hypothetical protein
MPNSKQTSTPAKIIIQGRDGKDALSVWVDRLNAEVVIEQPGHHDGECTTARLTFDQWADTVRHVEYIRQRG